MDAATCFVDDDDRYFGEGLAEALRTIPGVDLSEVAGSLQETLDHDSYIDVILLDLGRPNSCRRSVIGLHERWRDTAVLVITGHATGPDAVQAFAEGALGHVTKGVKPEEPERAIATVASGRSYATPSLAGHLLDAGLHLTAGELALLCLVAEGQSDKEIASTLDISFRMVENRIRLIRGKATLVNEPRSALRRLARGCDLGCLPRARDYQRTGLRRRTLR